MAWKDQTPGKSLPGVFVNRIGGQFKADLQRYC
jgi:hypothetical protein